jgi:tRNA (guanine37-N1)-methyltransferase
MAPYDILGNIVLMKFDRKKSSSAKKKEAAAFLATHKNIYTVLEKVSKFSGRLRTNKTKFVLGVKTKEALYKENNCVFRFDIEKCYFSPRLSAERNELASLIRKGESVLVLFGGVAPFAIVIAKTGKPRKVVSVELGKIPSKYAEMNVKANKVNVDVIQGDVKRVLPRLKEKFDRVIMARPNLKDDFLGVALPRVKNNGLLYYYGFYDEDKIGELTSLLVKEARKAKRKIKILKIKKAGDIGVRKYRYRADLKII